MKRKRFIKLLMSKGMQRNEANVFAKEICHLGVAYERCSLVSLYRISSRKYIVRFNNYFAWYRYRLLCRKSQEFDPNEFMGALLWMRTPYAYGSLLGKSPGFAY